MKTRIDIDIQLRLRSEDGERVFDEQWFCAGGQTPGEAINYAEAVLGNELWRAAKRMQEEFGEV